MSMRRTTGLGVVLLSALTLGMVLPLGCSGSPPASPPPASAVLIDMDGVRHRLPQAEADFLAGIVAAAPDTDSPDSLSLDPPYRVIVDTRDLALQPDELILMHRDGTKRWSAPGVQQRILKVVGK